MLRAGLGLDGGQEAGVVEEAPGLLRHVREALALADDRVHGPMIKRKGQCATQRQARECGVKRGGRLRPLLFHTVTFSRSGSGGLGLALRHHERAHLCQDAALDGDAGAGGVR